jgi:hypothetical protein
LPRLKPHSAEQFISPHGKVVLIGEKISLCFELYPQGVAFSSARVGPAAYGAQLHCAASGQKKEAFKYKKGEWLKCLKFLDPKRQFQTVNRHDRSVNRQNLLALLSFKCNAPDCLVTKLEHDYDA